MKLLTHPPRGDYPNPVSILHYYFFRRKIKHTLFYNIHTHINTKKTILSLHYELLMKDAKNNNNTHRVGQINKAKEGFLEEGSKQFSHTTMIHIEWDR